MEARCSLAAAVLAALLVRPAAAGFCSAQRSLLAADEDAFALSRRRSCGVGDRWRSEPTATELLYRAHGVPFDGNGTSLAGWLLLAGGGAPAEPAAPPANRTEAERRFQQKISAAFVSPLAKFGSRLAGPAPPDLAAFLRRLLTEKRRVVLDALREVSGERTLDRLLQRDGSLVRALSQAVSELVLLAADTSAQTRRVAVAAARRAPAQAAGDEPAGEPQGRRAPASRGLSAVTVSAPLALSLAAVVTLVPATLLALYVLFGLPASFLMASVVYSGFLFVWALARGIGESTLLAEHDAGLLLGRTMEAMVGGFFRMRLLRTALLFLMELVAGV